MTKSYNAPKGTAYHWDHLGTTERLLTSQFCILEGLKIVVHLWDASRGSEEKPRPEITVRLLYNGSNIYTWRPRYKNGCSHTNRKRDSPPPATPKDALDVRIQERLRDFAQELQAEVSELQEEAMEQAHIDRQLSSALDDDLMGTIADLGEKLQEFER